MNYTEKEMNLINRTARSWKNPPIIYRTVSNLHRKEKIRILDYGSGPNAIWTKWLREQGFHVTAYDIGKNLNKLHNPNALSQEYDMVVASNVLNVQPSRPKIIELLNELCVGKLVYLNYPEEPRKLKMTTTEMELLCKKVFRSVVRMDTIFSCVP